MSKWRSRTTGILIAGVVLILIALVASFMAANFQKTTEVKIGSGVFNARLATNEAARSKGLSGVESLSSIEGLLMVFDTDDTWGIWMKDMKIPIDIVWLDSDKKVIYIVTNAPPDTGEDKTYRPAELARYVLEIPAGMVKSSAIKIGSKATFTLEAAQ